MITFTTWHYDPPVWSCTAGLDGEVIEGVPQRCMQAAQLAGGEEGLDGDEGPWVWVNLTLH